MNLRWFPLAFLGVALGCQSSKEAVWVDLDQVLRSDRAIHRPPLVMPTPPKAQTQMTLTIPGRRAEKIADPSNPGHEDLRQNIQESQDRALRRLQRRLGEVYAREADRFARDQRRRLGDPERRAIAEVLPQFDRAFHEYADRRLAPVVELLNIVGFPDPNPKNTDPPPGLTPVQTAKLARAKVVRGKLIELDRAFDVQAQMILGQVRSLAAQERATFLAEVEGYRDKINQRALEEASNPLQGPSREVDLKLARPDPATLPAIPGQTVTLNAQGAGAPLPKVESFGTLSRPSTRLALAVQQLNIWLALNRKRLVDSPEGGRDATGEFELWRRNQVVGR